MKKNKKIKIVFWGTSEFAIPALEALLNAGYLIAAVVTAPDKPAGRKHILTPPPVKEWIKRQETKDKKIEILQPEKLDKSFMLHVSSFKPDIFIVAAYGKMIPAAFLAIPEYGALNIHPSLLPRWRGPSPIQYTILNGDAETGVTIMKVDEKMDHGQILAQQELKISKTVYSELHDVLAHMGAELLFKIMPKYIAGEIAPMPQDESRATYSKLLKKENGHIVWTQAAEEIERMVRAFGRWPGAYSFWKHGGKKLKIDILRVQTLNVKRQTPNAKSAGTVEKYNEKLCIQTGNDLLEILELQSESKKPVSAHSFLNGYPEIIGQVLA